MTVLLSTNPSMITAMKDDLIAKVKAAFGDSDIESRVMGVFSLDDLEKLNENDLAQSLAVGVGYASCGPINQTSAGQFNGDRAQAGKTLEFNFLVIVAVPATDGYATQHDAEMLLSILRLFILGSTIANDRVARTWEFVQEKPEIAASTRTMLYYSQLWRVSIPFLGKPQS